jgi:hypothetical protein
MEIVFPTLLREGGRNDTNHEQNGW